MKTLNGALAWLLAGAIVFWTLGPVADRPQSGHPQAERFAAFFVLAVLWTLAYPRRPGVAFAALSCAAVLLEMGQALVPGRDPGAPDVLAKVAGAAMGVMAVMGLRFIRANVARSRAATSD